MPFLDHTSVVHDLARHLHQLAHRRIVLHATGGLVASPKYKHQLQDAVRLDEVEKGLPCATSRAGPILSPSRVARGVSVRAKSSGGTIDLALVVGCLVAQAWASGHARPVFCPACVGRGVSRRNSR